MLAACSSNKNTALTRRVQAFKARYNTYFNGKAKAALTAEELALFNTYKIDRYIKQYTSATIKENELTNIPAGEKGSVVYNADELNLKIDPSYLTNGKYVYIIIEVIDTKGNVTIKKIKVEYKDILYNLT